MTKEINYDTIFTGALARKMGDVFEEAVKKYNLISFTEQFIKSDVFFDYYDDETIFSQSKKYVLVLFEEEAAKKNLIIQPEDAWYDKDVAYWMGYLLAIWRQRNHFDMNTLSHEDIEWLYDGYDTLHTQDVKYVCQLYQDERANINEKEKE